MLNIIWYIVHFFKIKRTLSLSLSLISLSVFLCRKQHPSKYHKLEENLTVSTNVTFAKRKSRRVSLTPIDATPLQVWPGEESWRATQLMPVKQELLLMSYRSNHGPVRLDFILCSVQMLWNTPSPLCRRHLLIVIM